MGKKALSLAELLAILLGTGTKGKSVICLAHEILSHFGSVSRLLEASIEELMEIKGVGTAKAIQLKATFALALKTVEKNDKRRAMIQSPEDIYNLIKSRFIGISREILVVVLRDIKKCAFHHEVISMGTLSELLIHPREVFQIAVRHSAHSLVLVHNHPSGDPTPSQADINATKHLLASSKIMGIRLDDHLIVGENCFTSLWEKKYLYRARY